MTDCGGGRGVGEGTGGGGVGELHQEGPSVLLCVVLLPAASSVCVEAPA
jgi:hypothetical protein